MYEEGKVTDWRTVISGVTLLKWPMLCMAQGSDRRDALQYFAWGPREYSTNYSSENIIGIHDF